MKAIKRIVLSLAIALAWWGCDSSEMGGYEGKDGVYFMMQLPPLSGYGDPEQYEYTDTTHISFASILGNDTLVPIRMRVMGNLADRDRYVSLEIVEEATTAKVGEDYEAFALNPCIKANERQTEVSCRIIRTDKLAKEDLVLYLVLRLQANADFELPLTWWQPFGNIYGDPVDSVNVVQHVIVIDNKVNQPEYWPDQYWGDWSVKKFTLMCDMFQMTWDDFKVMTAADGTKARIMGQNLDKYLKEKKADGDPVYEDERDEYGDLVEMTAGSEI